MIPLRLLAYVNEMDLLARLFLHLRKGFDEHLSRTEVHRIRCMYNYRDWIMLAQLPHLKSPETNTFIANDSLGDLLLVCFYIKLNGMGPQCLDFSRLFRGSYNSVDLDVREFQFNVVQEVTTAV